ncbi:MAG: TonB family protein, partial [Candidatus Acidiferrales bacterium]
SAASPAAAVAATAGPRTPAQSLWNIPPRELEPIIDRSFGSSFGSSFGAVATESLEERRPSSLWRVAGLAGLVVAACFGLGFAAGPFSLHVWPKVKDDGRMVLAKFGHEHAAAINVGGADSSPTNVAAPSVNAAAPAVPSAAAMSSAPDSAEPAAGNAAPSDANASSAGGNTVPPPAAVAPDTATIPPARTTGDADSTAKERGGEPPDSAARTTARDTPVEKAHASSDATTEAKANSAAGAGHAEVAAPSPTATETHETSPTPAESSSSGARAASAPAANSVESAAGPAIPAAPPQSYFPVVAPAAGNVPRLIQLPEEIVIDTAAVVIHSHQMVFVPAEPGPEASHELEKLQIGDRVTKVAPIYPPAAAQKGMGGTVHLLAVIGKDGKVQDVRPINGPIGLMTAAVDAILQWRYQPTLLNQQPIEMQEQFTIEFRPLGLPVR